MRTHDDTGVPGVTAWATPRLVTLAPAGDADLGGTKAQDGNSTQYGNS